MKNIYPKEWPSFFTATIDDWKPLLKEKKYKEIIIDSLKFLCHKQIVTVIGFVIMDNHVHIIWQSKGDNKIKLVENSFIKYTSKKFKETLIKDDQISNYKTNSPDREYQFWKRKSLSIELFSPNVLLQKLNYIHQNPVRAGLCEMAENYYFSSASFYETGMDTFEILTHYKG